jgi:hypothetical protein
VPLTKSVGRAAVAGRRQADSCRGIRPADPDLVDRQIQAAIEMLFARDHDDMLLVNSVADSTKT